MNFQKGQIVIFQADIYGNGEICEYDGTIVDVLAGRVNVIYLDGYHSRNDIVNFENIIAIVDKTKKCPYSKTKYFNGYFIPNPLYNS